MNHDIELTKEIVNCFQTGVLRHNLEFASAYDKLESSVSTYQNRWILVDYMFYTKSNKNDSDLKLVSYLALPSAENCESIGLKIPNSYLGSDHLSIAARFFLASNRHPSSSTKL